MRSRLSQRAQAEASKGGAKVWSEIIALGRAPGMINLGQGFPDYSGHGKARTSAEEALKAGKSDQYAAVTGTDQLRSSIATLYNKMYPGAPRPTGLDPATEVCVTTGGTEALFCAAMGLVSTGHPPAHTRCARAVWWCLVCHDL